MLYYMIARLLFSIFAGLMILALVNHAAVATFHSFDTDEVAQFYESAMENNSHYERDMTAVRSYVELAESKGADFSGSKFIADLIGR